MIKLLIVDDHSTFRQAIVALLRLQADLEIVGQAAHGNEAIALTEQYQPDVILMDVRMPICDGIEATREIHQRYPWIRILVLTTFDEDEDIARSLQAGALGYLLKDTPATELAAAIRAVYKGYSQLGPTIAPRVFSQIRYVAVTHSLTSEQYHLTEREIDILVLLCEGKSNQEISKVLYITEGTVKNNITRILEKLDLRDRTQAALWAKENFFNHG